MRDNFQNSSFLQGQHVGSVIANSFLEPYYAAQQNQRANQMTQLALQAHEDQLKQQAISNALQRQEFENRMNQFQTNLRMQPGVTQGLPGPVAGPIIPLPGQGGLNYSPQLELNQRDQAFRSREDIQRELQQPQIDEQNRIAGLALQDAPLNQIQQSAPNGLAPSASDIFQALEKRKSLFPQTGLLPHPISKPYRGTDGNLYQSVQDPTTGQFTTQKVQGAVEPAPTGTNQKATDSQQLFGIFGSRAAQSNKVLDHIESRVNTPTSKLDYLAGPFGPQLLGPYNPTNTFQLPFAVEGLKSQDRKMYEQAKRDFVNALLRKESGAAISSGEFDNADKQYFAQPGDGPQVVAQKQALRKLVVELFGKAAKGERTAMAQLESAGGTPSQPTVNNTIVMPDGAQFQYEPAN